MTEHNLPVPDDMPWVNLTQEEIMEQMNAEVVCGEVEPVIIDGDIGLYGGFSLRSEYFFGDCEVEDVKTRQDLMTNL